MLLEGEGDGDTAPRLLDALGVSADRLVLENKSRNTYENAVFTKELVTPKPGETWLLVTSAFHMPRSKALFDKAGFPTVPWPVDYRTTGSEGFGVFLDNAAGFAADHHHGDPRMDRAVRLLAVGPDRLALSRARTAEADHRLRASEKNCRRTSTARSSSVVNTKTIGSTNQPR